MVNRLASRCPPINIPSKRARRSAIGAAGIPVILLLGVLGSHPGIPHDSGVAGCRALSGAHQVAATEYPKIRVEFARSRWPDLRTAGTAYVDLATAILHARNTDGYETVWFYQRLSAACAKHGRALNI